MISLCSGSETLWSPYVNLSATERLHIVLVQIARVLVQCTHVQQIFLRSCPLLPRRNLYVVVTGFFGS